MNTAAVVTVVAVAVVGAVEAVDADLAVTNTHSQLDAHLTQPPEVAQIELTQVGPSATSQPVTPATAGAGAVEVR